MAKEKKAKVELTLEELQARKAKRQRGWVRFCAIILAAALTVGMYGVASQGEPEIVKIQPTVVRVNTPVAGSQNNTPATPDTPSDDGSSTVAPPATSSDEGGGILDMIMGLLGGIDFSKIAGMLDINGLGVKVAGGIDTLRDSLLNLVDKLEGIFGPADKPVVSHDAVEHPFMDGSDIGDAEAREAVAALLNKATAEAANANYEINRNSAFINDVSIGEQTDTINSVLGSVKDDNGNPYSLNTFVGSLIDAGETKAAVEKGVLPENVNPNFALMATQLKADDIAILSAETNEDAGTYAVMLKNVDHPNRQADCGLTRLTNDYLVKSEMEAEVARLAAINVNNTTLSGLKLSDFETSYTDIVVKFTVNPETMQLTSLTYDCIAYGKFTVRTNTVQIVGAATSKNTTTYSNFVF